MNTRTPVLFKLLAGFVAICSAASASTIVNLSAATGTPDVLSLGPGEYSIQIVGTSTSGALYNGWNSNASTSSTNNLWTDAYGIRFDSGDQLGFQISGNPTYATATAALTAYTTATQLQVYDYTGSYAGGMYSNPFTFTIPTAETITLSLPNWNSSYTGGESLAVSQIPEPGTSSLLAGALLVAAGLMRRKVTGRLKS